MLNISVWGGGGNVLCDGEAVKSYDAAEGTFGGVR